MFLKIFFNVVYLLLLHEKKFLSKKDLFAKKPNGSIDLWR